MVSHKTFPSQIHRTINKDTQNLWKAAASLWCVCQARMQAITTRKQWLWEWKGCTKGRKKRQGRAEGFWQHYLLQLLQTRRRLSPQSHILPSRVISFGAGIWRLLSYRHTVLASSTENMGELCACVHSKFQLDSIAGYLFTKMYTYYTYIYIYMFSDDLIYVCVYVYIHTNTHTWTLFSGITATRWVGTWFNTGAEPREGFVVTLEESNRVDRAVVRNCKARKTNLSNEKMIMPQHDWGKKSRSFDQLCSMLPLPWHKRKSVILHNLVVDTRAHTHIHITEYLSNLLLSPQNSITTLHNW